LPRGPIVDAVPETLERYAAAALPKDAAPPVLIGGADLLRAGVVAEESDKPGPAVAYGLHRVNHARLGWWFERLRGWQFATNEAIARLVTATSGIPVLAGLADEFLAQRLEKGADVSAEVFSQLEALLEGAPAIAAKLLIDGPPAARLQPRERELLKMAVIVAKNTAGYPRAVAFDVEEELRRQWELYREQLPDARPLEAALDDRVALRFLRLSGLLPLDAAGRLRFRDDDALYRLAPLL